MHATQFNLHFFAPVCCTLQLEIAAYKCTSSMLYATGYVTGYVCFIAYASCLKILKSSI